MRCPTFIALAWACLAAPAKVMQLGALDMPARAVADMVRSDMAAVAGGLLVGLVCYPLWVFASLVSTASGAGAVCASYLTTIAYFFGVLVAGVVPRGTVQLVNVPQMHQMSAGLAGIVGLVVGLAASFGVVSGNVVHPGAESWQAWCRFVPSWSPVWVIMPAAVVGFVGTYLIRPPDVVRPARTSVFARPVPAAE